MTEVATREPSFLVLPETIAGKFLLTETSLEIDTAMTFDEWTLLGEQLGRVNRVSSWAIGDWLLEGFSQFGDRYTEAERRTGLARESLYRLKWVAEKVDSSRRRRSLDFEHHVAVASLPPDEQTHWLLVAENEGWPVEMLRDELRRSRNGAVSAPIRLSLTLPSSEAARAERWRHAAQESELEFAEWVARALDRACEVIDA